MTDSTPDVCSICLGAIKLQHINNNFITICNHMFHRSCLQHWCMVKNSCPDCRTEHVMSGKDLGSNVVYVNKVNNANSANSANNVINNIRENHEMNNEIIFNGLSQNTYDSYNPDIAGESDNEHVNEYVNEYYVREDYLNENDNGPARSLYHYFASFSNASR